MAKTKLYFGDMFIHKNGNVYALFNKHSPTDNEVITAKSNVGLIFFIFNNHDKYGAREQGDFTYSDIKQIVSNSVYICNIGEEIFKNYSKLDSLLIEGKLKPDEVFI